MVSGILNVRLSDCLLYFIEFKRLQNKIENNHLHWPSRLIMMHIIGIHKVLRRFFPGVKCPGRPGPEPRLPGT